MRPLTPDELASLPPIDGLHLTDGHYHPGLRAGCSRCIDDPILDKGAEDARLLRLDDVQRAARSAALDRLQGR